jgi:hypothetical protein
MSIFSKFLDWLLPPQPAYYYRINPQTDEVEKVVESKPESKAEELPEELDLPLFTTDELQEMTKSDLLELAVNSGIHGVSKKNTKKQLIEEICSHYEIEQ